MFRNVSSCLLPPWCSQMPCGPCADLMAGIKTFWIPHCLHFVWIWDHLYQRSSKQAGWMPLNDWMSSIQRRKRAMGSAWIKRKSTTWWSVLTNTFGRMTHAEKGIMSLHCERTDGQKTNIRNHTYTGTHKITCTYHTCKQVHSTMYA